jgi:serine protease Do
MRLIIKVIGLGVVVVGLAAAAVVYAPTVFGQTAVRVDRDPLVQVLELGGSHIGASVRDVDKADVEREKLPGQWGAVVEEVRAGSPAERAGLRAGDVIVEFDGERVRSARELTRLVRETPDGRTVKAAVVRGGRRLDVEVTPDRREPFVALGETGRVLDRLNRDLPLEIERNLDRLRDLHLPPMDFDAIRVGPRLGATVQDLTPQLAGYFGVEAGVLVTGVSEGSVAATAGLKAGDVITALDGARISDTSDLRRRLSRLDDGAQFSLGIVRDKQTLTLTGKTEDTRVRVRRRVVL